MSKPLFDALILLAGVVVGGFITYLTTRALDTRKWKQQKADRLQERRRDALELALQWIPPIHFALSQASLLVSRFLKDDISTNEFLKRWPRLLHQLIKKDLPLGLSVLLPPNVISRSELIVKQLEELQTFALSSKHKTKLQKDEWIKRFHSFSEKGDIIQINFEKFKRELISEYINTFS